MFTLIWPLVFELAIEYFRSVLVGCIPCNTLSPSVTGIFEFIGLPEIS